MPDSRVLLVDGRIATIRPLRRRPLRGARRSGGGRGRAGRRSRPPGTGRRHVAAGTPRLGGPGTRRAAVRRRGAHRDSAMMRVSVTPGCRSGSGPRAPAVTSRSTWTPAIRQWSGSASGRRRVRPARCAGAAGHLRRSDGAPQAVRRVGDAVRRHGMRMVGPNCLGMANTEPGAWWTSQRCTRWSTTSAMWPGTSDVRARHDSGVVRGAEAGAGL